MVWMGRHAERRRFQRHLRRQYDACRFRYPPQTKAILDSAEQSGRLRFHAGSDRRRGDHRAFMSPGAIASRVRSNPLLLTK
jgi:uncharacterized NAD(P)/FAD-binding protein YdhS